jgi:thiosulfate/3-mercaptopyruvate sulfurtransferase
MNRLRLFLSLLFCMSASTVRGADYPRGELLVSPSQLSKDSLRSQAPTIVLDVRPKADYEAGHVPSAQWLSVAQWSKSFDDGRDPESWTKRIADLGISNDSQVIVYDDGNAKDAARVWWLLRYWGVRNARLLNGGFAAWRSDSLPLQNQSNESPRRGNFKAEPEKDRLATKQSILTSLKEGGNLQIVDSRSEGEFCGTEPGANKRGGAIPGAKNLEWSELLDSKTKRFKPASELREIFKQAGVDLDKPTAAHCQSGGRSSVMVFGMELMGADHVANYYRSWAEWGNADDTPIEPGKPKTVKPKNDAKEPK